MGSIGLAEAAAVPDLERKVGIPPPRAVDVVHSRELPYRDFLQRFVRSNRSVVISDAVTEWPALRKGVRRKQSKFFAAPPGHIDFGEH